jgi:hypothetical protein
MNTGIVRILLVTIALTAVAVTVRAEDVEVVTPFRFTGVATENLIPHELTSEVPNRVITPGHAGDDRIAAALASVAREVATPARS